ncbi:MAG: methyltransferase, partial [Planctomycetes bacterium]|nr:methyltransferase [Planctomycetota bacterium]
VLLESCLKALPNILSGIQPATDVMFPSSSMKLVEGIYRGNPLSDYFNEALDNTLVEAIRQKRKSDKGCKIRILEIGAGTGGTTAKLLPMLQEFSEYIEEYCYTDLSKAFLMHAEEKYKPGFPVLTTTIFDASRPLAGQSIASDHYDFVIAANVLHATPNIRETLRNVKATLKNRGILLLNEINGWSLFAHLTFGLLEGWWFYEDVALRLEGCPGLLPDTWNNVLEEEGFESIFFPTENAHRFGQQVITASSDGIVRQKVIMKNRSITSVPEVLRKIEKHTFSGNTLDAQEFVNDTIKESLSECLKISNCKIENDVSFYDYGLDSILSAGFIKNVNDSLEINLETSILFEYSNVISLSQYVTENYKSQIENVRALSPDGSDLRDVVVAAENEVSKVSNQRKSRVYSRTSQPSSYNRNRTSVSTEYPEIAIIGMSGQFPKAKDINEFWENLISGVDGVTELPLHILNQARYFSPEKQQGKTYCKWGGFLEAREFFDPLFFNLSPREAESMNIHQKLVLQEGWKALEDAGYNPKNLANSKTGVFIGAEPAGYYHESFTGASDAIIASRLAYYLNLRGPAFVVNTGCSSSGVALHLACESLRNGESDVAIAGGVFATLGSELLITLSQTEMISPTGKCYTFDSSADGTAFSEGIGIVILKRIKDAINDQDSVYGTICGSGINQDGASNGITAPNGLAQEQLMRDVYEKFEINPDDISYVEAHGTGTKLGDPVEANALVRAFNDYTKKKYFCAIGSAKAHIGHTAAGAGVIGLIKVLLSMQHHQIPKLLNFTKINSLIELKDSPFFINTQVSEWKSRADSPRMAALNSFGHSGTNAHLVIKEYFPSQSVQNKVGITRDELPVLIPFSAKTEECLKAIIKDFCFFLNGQQSNYLDKKITLEMIAHTLQTGREPMKYRIVFLVGSISTLKKQLDSFLKGEKDKKNCWEGKVESEQVSLLSSDDDVEEMLKSWIEKNKLKKIGELWCRGISIPWDLLYGDTKPGRVHLPTYSFARERYWIKETQRNGITTKGASVSVINPLLHENTSDLSVQRFTSTFTGNEFFLNDHLLKGEKILPVVCYLEMARAAVVNNSGETADGTSVHMKNVMWRQPIVVNNSDQKVHIELFGNDSGQIQFEVYTQFANEEEYIVHSQGVAEVTTKEETPPLDINNLQSHMNQGVLNAENCYEAFKEVGIYYGRGLRGIREIYQGEKQLLASLSIPSSVQDTQSEYVLHPGLLDAMLQSSIGFIINNGALEVDNGAPSGIN